MAISFIVLQNTVVSRLLSPAISCFNCCFFGLKFVYFTSLESRKLFLLFLRDSVLFKVFKLLGLLSMNEAAVQFLFFVLFCIYSSKTTIISVATQQFNDHNSSLLRVDYMQLWGK